MSTALAEQWQRFTASPYPRGLVIDVDGIDLVDLDATAAGHVHTTMKRPALADERRAALLACQDRVRRVLPHLDGAGYDHFAALAALIDTALLTTST